VLAGAGDALLDHSHEFDRQRERTASQVAFRNPIHDDVVSIDAGAHRLLKPQVRLPIERTKACTWRTYSSYNSSGMPNGSSAPIKMYSPGKTSAISASAASITWYVAGSAGSSHAVDSGSNSSMLRPLFSSGRKLH